MFYEPEEKLISVYNRGNIVRRFRFKFKFNEFIYNNNLLSKQMRKICKIVFTNKQLISRGKCAIFL